MNFYKHHLGDYAEATAHLTFVEDAAYFRLIRKYYASERPLPADVGTVQRLVGARTREEKKAVSRVLEEFFFLEADGWHNKRCDAEIARARHQMEINRRIANERWKSNKNNELGEQPEAVDEEKTGTNRTRFVHEPSTNRSTNRTRTEVRTVYEQSTNRQPSHKPLSNIHNPLSNKKNLDTGDLNTDTSSLPEDGSESDDSSDSAPALSAQARVVFAHWQKVMNKTRARLDDRRRRCILWALRNYGLDNCLQAIDGCAASAWHQGVNDRGVAYNDLTLIFRNAEKTEHFLEIAQQNPSRTSASAPDPTSTPRPDWLANRNRCGSNRSASLPVADPAENPKPPPIFRPRRTWNARRPTLWRFPNRPCRPHRRPLPRRGTTFPFPRQRPDRQEVLPWIWITTCNFSPRP